MAVSSITQSKPSPSIAPARQRVPQAGMRGGLGRTLLTAFLILAIGPLSLVGYLAFDQVRIDQQQRVLDRLALVANLTVAQLEDWAEGRVFSLALIANSPIINELITWFEEHPSTTNIPTGRLPITISQSQDLESVWLYNTQSGQMWPIAGNSSNWQADQILPAQERFPQAIKFTVHSDGKARFVITQPINLAGKVNFYLVGVAKMPERFFTSKLLNNPASTERLYFASQSGKVFSLSGEPMDTPPTLEALRMLEAAKLSIQPYRAMKDGQGLYTNYAGVAVLGAYHWLDDIGCAVVAEQDQTSVVTVSDRFAAGLIAAILAVSLLTAIIAAVVTRQVTRPIVRLSEVALRMAEGDLSQRVVIDRRDEIGILAHVFNKMAADLGELYAGLERKVAERTSELQAAKEQIQYHAWQLSISAEVGRITTSILDLDTLLDKASHLIRDAFQLDHVGIYLLDSSRRIAFLRESAGRAVPDYERQLHAGGTHPVSQVVLHGLPVACTKTADQDGSQCQQLVLPLILGKRVIGALDLTSYDPIGFSESDQQVLQALAGQLTVAVENARAYGREHAIADEMREVDRLRGQFLARMSHQLATYLNNVIGFSQILLKGLDGPLTELQAKDLAAIHQSGQQLQQLLNDILELANLEVGAIDINPAQVNLDDLISDLRTTLPSALVNPQLQLDIQAEQALPILLADADRLRQVLTNLVVTAAEKSHEGIIRLCVTSDKDHVQFVVNAPVELDSTEGSQGISLALSRRLIELHDARLRVEQYEGAITFSFSLATSRKVETDKKEPGL